MSIGELEVPTAVVIGISAVGALALVWWAVATYNRLIKQRNQVRSSWAQIDVQLKRRYDLIPNLVAVIAARELVHGCVLGDLVRIRVRPWSRRVIEVNRAPLDIPHQVSGASPEFA